MVPEAWASRVPLITTDAQGPAEVVRDGSDALLVPRGDLLTIGVALALWFASSGVEAMRVGLNRAYGKVERQITLPETADPESIEAELRDGILHLTFKKKPEAQPRRISVK